MRELERSLGLVPVIAIALSAMLGTGVFVLPGLAAELSGPQVWIAYLVAGVCVFPAAASKAELATAMPTSGGAFVYLDRLFGPWVGTVSGVALWLSSLLKAAFALLGVGIYLAALGDVPLKPVALVLLVAIVAVNLVGVQAVGRAQVFIVSGTLMALGAFVLFGLWQPAQHHDAVLNGSGGIQGIATAAGFVIVVFNGVTKIAAIAEEVRRPERVVPRGIFASLIIVTLTYCLVAWVLERGLTTQEFIGNTKPLVTWAQREGGPVLATVVAVIAVLSLVSLANTGLLAASRFPFAMSRDDLLPASVARISPRFSTPTVSILVTGTAMAFAIVSFDVAKLAKLASALVIGIYVANNLAVIAFRESGVGWYRPGYHSPLYPWLPAFGIASGLVLMGLLGLTTLAAFGGAAGLGTVVYAFYGRRRTRRRGVLLQKGRRDDLLKPEGPPPSSSQPASLDASLPDIEDSIQGPARAMVAVFGDERGPEMLVEVGTALAAGGRLPVVHLTEVPEQTILGAVQEAPLLVSLRRRILVMAHEEGTDVDFHAVASRDIVQTVHRATLRVGCDFLVMRWHGRGTWALSAYNPLGWLIDHLPCNLALFRDVGVRYIREILVFAAPGPHDALVVGTADDLAHQWGARLTIMRPVLSDASPAKRAAEREYAEQLTRLCQAPSQVVIIEANTIVEAVARKTTGYDLLVMGAPQEGLLKWLVGGSTERIIRTAACSVLSLKTPRVKTHEAYSRKKSSTEVKLGDVLSAEACQARLELSRKESLFEAAGDALAPVTGVGARAIVDALWDRERSQNTSVGQGVALPHATLEATARTVVGIITLRRGVDYRGPDGIDVDVCLVVLSPPKERELHLSLLSSIARLCLTTQLLRDLRAAATPREVVEAVTRAEAEVEASSRHS